MDILQLNKQIIYDYSNAKLELNLENNNNNIIIIEISISNMIIIMIIIIIPAFKSKLNKAWSVPPWFRLEKLSRKKKSEWKTTRKNRFNTVNETIIILTMNEYYLISKF